MPTFGLPGSSRLLSLGFAPSIRAFGRYGGPPPPTRPTAYPSAASRTDALTI